MWIVKFILSDKVISIVHIPFNVLAFVLIVVTIHRIWPSSNSTSTKVDISINFVLSDHPPTTHPE